ncbi:MAG: O-antigen ligase family protein [Bacilli bacterium]|nr:O-antigen ligase family protein [Bacilli bacterium]
MKINEEKIKNLLLLFMITYPIFDTRYFYNSITTLIRIIVIFIIFFSVIIANKESRKNLKWLTFYYILVIIYTLLHHLNALNFNSLVPGNFNYSLFKESLQILKLTTPVIFLYTLYYIKLTKEDYYKVIKSWIIIISGSIILLNVLKLSYGSYNDEIILGNIFIWFTNHKFVYSELASKGLFMYANQISMILLLLLVNTYYIYLKKQKKQDLLLITMILISALMLGTRVSSYGTIIVFFMLFLLYVFFSIEKKEFDLNKKIIINSLVITIIYILLLPISPANNRLNTYNNISDKLTSNKQLELVANNLNPSLIEVDKIEYISNNYEEKRIHEKFILESYPYQYDPDFWYDILQLPVNQRIDYRFLEISMVKRVIEINNNPSDKLFGITNTRIQNIFNIERDFVLQYYAFGITGLVLFLGLYIFLLVIVFKKWVTNFNYFNSIGLIIILLYLLASYVSGNIINHLSTNLIFVFIITQFYKKTNNMTKGTKKLKTTD